MAAGALIYSPTLTYSEIAKKWERAALQHFLNRPVRLEHRGIGVRTCGGV